MTMTTTAQQRALATQQAQTAEKTGATVELTGLRRRFGATQALDGFTLTLVPGELVALLGSTGRFIALYAALFAAGVLL